MPLIIVTGFPCSGKSQRRHELETELRAMGKTVVVVQDQQHTSLTSAESSSEKIARGWLRSEVERVVDKQSFVIVDSLNYIKGFRYELYCLAKAVPTPACVLHCATSDSTCREWNKARQSAATPLECSDSKAEPTPADSASVTTTTDNDSTAAAAATSDVAYSDEVFEALLMRYECPDSRNRWDQPLFTVEPEEAVPVAAMVKALEGARTRQNKSTQKAPAKSGNFLQELDRTTQAIIKVWLWLQCDELTQPRK